MGRQVVNREEYLKRESDPYRIECPEGHTTVSLKQSEPVEKWEGHWGWSEKVTVHSEHRGAEWSGAFLCNQCGHAHEEVYDKKTEEWLVLSYDVTEDDSF